MLKKDFRKEWACLQAAAWREFCGFSDRTARLKVAGLTLKIQSSSKLRQFWKWQAEVPDTPLGLTGIGNTDCRFVGTDVYLRNGQFHQPLNHTTWNYGMQFARSYAYQAARVLLFLRFVWHVWPVSNERHWQYLTVPVSTGPSQPRNSCALQTMQWGALPWLNYLT